MTLGKITPESAGTIAAVAIITAQPGIRTAQIAQKADWTLNHAQKLLREVARLGLIHALREDGNHCAWFAPQHIEEAAEAAKLAAKDRKRRENKREHERRKMRVRSGSDPWKYRDLPDSPTHSAADAKAPLPFKLRPGAVRNLEDLRDRCAIDDETGCWHWRLAVATSRGGMIPMVHLVAGVLPGVDRAATAPAARAAWLLSGRRLAPGHVVYRHLCEAKRCINPEHCAAGTRPQALAAVAATGRNRGKPERAVITAKARRSLVKPAEVVRQAEQMFAAGEMQKVVRAQLGLSQKTAAAIRQGRHVHSAARQGLLRGASVFTLGVPAT